MFSLHYASRAHSLKNTLKCTGMNTSKLSRTHMHTVTGFTHRFPPLYVCSDHHRRKLKHLFAFSEFSFNALFCQLVEIDLICCSFFCDGTTVLVSPFIAPSRVRAVLRYCESSFTLKASPHLIVKTLQTSFCFIGVRGKLPHLA